MTQKNKKQVSKSQEKVKQYSQLIERIIQHFKDNNGIMKKTEYNQQVKKPDKTVWGVRLFKGLQNNTGSWLNETQKQIGSIIIEPSGRSPSQLELTNEWKQHLSIK